MNFVYRLLQADNPDDVATVWQVLAATPSYGLLVEGKLPEPAAASELLEELPPGKTRADKFVLAFHADAELVGCADLIRGYPNDDIAFIGLLMFGEQFQGKGLGIAAFRQIAALAVSWGCRALRLAVIDKNLRAHRFWSRLGFVEIYRKDVPRYTGSAVVMELALGGTP